MNNFIKKMKLLCLRKVNSDATGYVQSTQTIQTNLYTNCYREIRKYRRHISFFITPIILSSLIACGAGGGDATTALTSPANIDTTSLGFTSLRVTWDNMPQAERYEVYDSNGVKIATVIPPATNYDATGLLPNTEYTYSIKACNSASCSAPVTSTATTNGNKNGGNTIINSVAELNAIRADSSTLAGNYILTTDIDLSSIENWQPIGDSTNSFTGSFDGSGNEISGMTISGNEYAGLFGYVHGASISNLGVKVNNINAYSSHAYAGGLAAHANSSLISNVYVIVAKNITSSALSSSYAGGLFGRIDESRISNSYVVVHGSIDSYVSDYSNSYAGGLVGYAHSSLISNSYYSASRVTLQGGFTDVTGTYGIAKTVEQLQALNATNTDWDSETWNFGTKNDLPILSSEFVPNVEPPPVTAPASPGGVTVTPLSSTSMRVSWNSVSDVKLYRLYDNRGGAVINIAPPATSYNARDLLPNTGYTYRVAACNESGCSVFTRGSAATLPASITPPNPVTIPSVPASPRSIRAGSLSLTATSISWDRVDAAEYYEVHNNDKLVTTINHPATTSYTVTNLSPNTVYTYSVKACNDSGCSASIEVTFVTAPIGVSGAPQVTAVASTIGQAMPSLNVSWGRIRGVTSYQIFDAAGNNIVNVFSPATNHIIADLSADTLYEYKVRGCYTSSVPTSSPGSSEVCGDFSEVGSATTTPVAIPAVPNNVAAISQTLTSINISWDSVDGAERYEVRNSDGLVATIDHPATTYTATDLLPATEYTYEIKACNTSGCSDFVSVSAITGVVSISNAADLAAIRTNDATLAGNYTLTGNIDLSQIPNWQPIGNGTNKFTGSFDGNDYNISGVSSSGYQYAGLFGYVEDANISNVGVLVGNISSSDSKSYSGGLVGRADDSPISNSYALVTGGISSSSSLSSSSSYSGGLVGRADSSPISNSYAVVEGSISSSSRHFPSRSGGLVGYASLSPISNSYAIVGGSISSSSSSSSSSFSASSGGLVGRAISIQISNSYAVVGGSISSSSLLDKSHSHSGGLVGHALRSPISNSYAVVGGNISSSSNSVSYSGGLVGYASISSISNSYAVVGGSISSSSSSSLSRSSSSNSYSGGLVGLASDRYISGNQISNSYAMVGGNISSSSSSYSSSGGLVGWALSSLISNSYAVVGGSISSSSRSDSYSGGLVGRAAGSQISNSYYSAIRKSSEGEFTNELGTSETLSGLRELTAGATGWSVRIWDFYPDTNLPTLDSLPFLAVTRYLASPEYVIVTALGLSTIGISWGSVDGAASYEVHNSEGLVTTIGYPATSYIATGLLPNKEYTYSVRACYLFSCSAFTSASATTMVVEISSAADLAAIRSNRATLAGGYNLTGNIDLSDIPNWQPIGNLTNRFTGSFNGNGYNISGVSSSGHRYAGLFGYVENANISNVGVLVGNISSSSDDYSYSGGLVGLASDSQISNSYAVVEGNISSSSRLSSFSGGLVGGAPNSPISNSYAVVGGSISSSSSSPSSSYSGGLVGGASNSPVSNSYAVVEGNISSSSPPSSSYSSQHYSYSGGLVGGASNSPIINSYAVVEGSISSSYGYSPYSGGLVGDASRSPISNSYAVVEGNISSSSSRLSSYSGGLVGRASDSQISNSYAVVGGSISSSSSRYSAYSGGLVGWAYDNSISNSYYSVSRKSLEGEFSNTLGTATTLSGLRELTADITSWDEGIWDFGTDANLPILRSFPSPAITRSPSSPEYVIVTASGLTTISISWGSVDGAASYEVHNSGGLVTTIKAPATTYIATGLLPNTEYTYSVKACNTSGCSDFVSVSAITGVVSISSAAELAAIRTDSNTLAGNYTLTGNIDLSDIPNWQPIGDSTNKFTGSFDGNGYNISGVSSLGYQNAGLFGYVENADIRNIGVLVGNVSTSSSDANSYSGGLVGRASSSEISNSYAVVGGSISSSSSYNSYSGGLVGRASSSEISNSYAVVGGSISSSSNSFSGGLVGYAYESEISNSYALVGGSISSSSSSSSSYNSFSGGLVGYASDSEISNSYALVGGSISSSSSSSSSSSRSYSGGLVGFARDSEISNSYALVGVSISSSSSSRSYSGGLVGYASDSPISNSYALVGVSISSSSSSRSYSGGLVGYASDSPISNSYALVGGSISSSSGNVFSYSGGLVGYASDSPISNSYYRANRKSSEGGFTNTLGTATTLSGLRELNAGTTGWDESIWDFGTDANPPTLRSLPSPTVTRSLASPEYVTATASGLTAISISWGSIDGAASYEVHNSEGLVASIGHPTTSYGVIDIDLLPNTEYTYKVRACYLFSCSDFASASAITMIVRISSAAEFAAIRSNRATLAGDYNLTGNIDLSDIPNWQPIGDEANRFTGSFDGNGYNISGVSSSGYQYAGLFGYVENSNISNVGVLVGNISSSSSSSSSRSDSNSGGLVGRADESEISNSYALVGGSISSSSSSSSSRSDSNSGGLVGYAVDSEISNSYALVEGSISSSSSSRSDSNSGGLVGYAVDSPISNSYAVVGGSISSSSLLSYSGGLVGYARYSPISNSYAVVGGSISSSSSLLSYSGGLVGRTYDSPISNSYAVVEGSISSSSSSSDSSYSSSGGLVGYADESPISNSYAVVEGNISSSSRSLSSRSSSSRYSSYSGGLVGYADESPISNSYAVVEGNISSSSRSLSSRSSSSSSSRYSSYSGGLVGRAVSRSRISNSYYSVSRKFLEGEFVNSHGTSETLSGLRALTAAATTWDEGIWDFGTDANLPILRSLPSPAATRSPASPGDVTATASGLSAISISWVRADKATSYEVHNSSGLVTTIESPATSYAATGLLPATQYTYRVRACNVFSCSDFVSTTAMTPVAIPATPSNVAAISFGFTSIGISWNSVVGADNYEVHNNEVLVATIEYPATNYIATGLLPNTEYIYSVSACNDSGCSASAIATATTENAIIINNAADLAAIHTNSTTLAGNYTLAGNIDLSQIPNWQPIGDSANKFTGSFDGNGYNISGVSSSGYQYAGLFGYVEGANISNIGVLVGNISSSSSTRSSSGGLVGSADNSPISNSYAVVTGNISSSSSSYSRSGGLVGRAYNSPISNSYALVGGSISSSSPSSGSNSYSGGLVGYPDNSPISNSYAVVGGSISSSANYRSSSGGLVGYAYISPISNSYTLVGGDISSSDLSDSFSYSGGLVGRIVGNSPISKSYYSASRESSEGEFTNELGTAATLSGLRELDAGTTGWSAVIWDFGTDANPPRLRSLPFHTITRYLASPEYVTATASGLSAISMSWGSVDGAASYEVYNRGVLVTTIKAPATNYIATGLLPNKEYTYSVRACYLFDCSDFVSATAMILVAIPATPSNVAAISFGFTSISISWDSVVGADNYEVHNNEVLVATIEYPATNYIATGLLPNTEYTYEVKACNNYGCSASASAAATTENAIIINSATELAAIRANDATLSGNYALTGNIDLSDIPNWQPIGNGTNKFTGSFDGNGYNISGVSSSGYQYAGLFGYVENANISNVGVLVGSISSSSSYTSISYSGGLVGYASSSPISNSYAVVTGYISSSSRFQSYSGGLVGGAWSSQISNSYAVVTGNISSSSSRDSLSGGLVGWAHGSQISNSYAVVEGNISSLSPSSSSYSGGLVGYAYRSEISNSYALVTGNISSSSAAALSHSGGLVGRAYESSISKSYALVGGSISSSSSRSNSYSGGLVGRADDDSLISNSYYSASRKSSEGEFTNELGTAATLSGLRELDAGTTGWDVGIWDFGTYANLPILRSLPSPAVTPSPASPGDFTATALGLISISMSWGSVDGAASYEVYNRGVLVTTIKAPATTYNASSLLPDTEYTYRVRACNLFGCSVFVRASATTEDGTLINNAAELAAIRTNSNTLAGNYALTENIDLSSIPNWQPIGNGTNKFTGSFDGYGYNISGISSSGYQYAGLFGYVENTDISNVGVLVGNISSSSSFNSYSGGLVGYADGSEISNSYAVVEGNISSSSSFNSYSGGLVGYAYYSQISNSYAVVEGNISSSSYRSPSYSGGLVGETYNSPISNSYAVVGGSISSSSSSYSAYSGGLVGGAYNDSPISNSYAVVGGSISSSSFRSSYSGGLVGETYNIPISNSYAVVGGSISSSSSFRSSYSGGLVGEAGDSPISNSYALVGGNISSSSSLSAYSGGLVGSAYDDSQISNSYYSASRESSEGGFTNSLGTAASISGLRELNAGTTGWDEGIWDFGSDNDLPMLVGNPITVDLPLVFRE